MKTQYFEIRLEFTTPGWAASAFNKLQWKVIQTRLQDTIFVGEEPQGAYSREGRCVVIGVHPPEEYLDEVGGFNRNVSALTKLAQQLKPMFTNLIAIEVYGYSDRPDRQYASVLWNWRYDCASETYLQCEMPETLQYHFTVKEDTLPSHASRALLEFLIRNHDKTARELLRYH
jgi:hypothetical protein